MWYEDMWLGESAAAEEWGTHILVITANHLTIRHLQTKRESFQTDVSARTNARQTKAELKERAQLYACTCKERHGTRFRFDVQTHTQARSHTPAHTQNLSFVNTHRFNKSNIVLWPTLRQKLILKETMLLYTCREKP